jgi:hypothetical protein
MVQTFMNGYLCIRLWIDRQQGMPVTLLAHQIGLYAKPNWTSQRQEDSLCVCLL